MFGSHLSIAGGLFKAVDAAAALGMQTVQIFTHSPSQWAVKPAAATVPADATTPAMPRTAAVKAIGKTSGEAAKTASQPIGTTVAQWITKPLAPADVHAFRAAIDRTGLQQPCAHDSYLINLGTSDETLWSRSIEAVVHELECADALGLAGVVMHPGAAVGSTEEAALRRIVDGLNEVHRRTPKAVAQLWLETTAGQGTGLGSRFEELAYILENSRYPDLLGVCIDTCHIFAAGYELLSPAGYAATVAALETTVGLDKVRFFHLNDSKTERSSKVDRHEHIGKGTIGLEGFRNLLQDCRFADRPMILETPKGADLDEDLENLQTLRLLL